MIVALIDLGTNTFNLLVYNAASKEYLVNQKVPVHLGRGGLKEGILTSESMMRGLDAIKNHLKTANEHGAEVCHAFACSAVRSAKNKDEFVGLVKRETGIEIRVLTGEEEAEWIFRGVCLAVPVAKSPVMVMDIGGGSTELIIGNEDGIQWLESYNLGVSRLLENFSPQDPLSLTDITSIRNHIETAWNAIPMMDVSLELIGSSGSFDTLAALYLASNNIHKESTNGLNMPVEDMRSLCARLLQSTEAERHAMPGMDLSRVHHIHLSALLIEVLLDKMDVSRITVSNFALKEGAVDFLVNG